MDLQRDQDVGGTRPVADIYGPPFFQMGDVVTNTCKVCFHAILFTLNQVLYFIEFIYLTFPNLVQLQLGAYSLIIEVRWSTL